MTGGAPNPPFFFHTGLRHMAWKDFGGSHNTPTVVTKRRVKDRVESSEGSLLLLQDQDALLAVAAGTE